MRTALALLLLAPLAAPAAAKGDAPPTSRLKERATEVAKDLYALNVPAIPEAVQARIKQYQNTRSASFNDWVGDGSGGILITTRFAETAQLHRVAIPMGAREQLTFEDEPVRSARWTRVGGQPGFVYMSDVGGAEAFQVLFYDTDRGIHALMSDGKARHTAPLPSPRGRWVAFSGTGRNGTDYDLYLSDAKKAAGTPPERVTTTKGYWAPVAWAPDERELLLINYVSANEASLHRLNLRSKALTPLAELAGIKAQIAGKDKVYFGSAAYAGGGLYFVSNMWGEFRQLGYVDLESGAVRLVTGDIPWDLEGVTVDPKGKLLAFVVNEDGMSRLHVRRLPDDTSRVKLPALPVGLYRNPRFDPRGERLAFAVNGPQSPSDVYSVDLSKARVPAPTRWTRSEVGGLDTSKFVAPTLVRYPTFDKDERGETRQIPAFYYKPPGPGPHPVVVYIHGGPEGQFRPYFSSRIQHWVNELGIAIVAPNVRGSAGYGKSWLLLDNGFKREDSVKDIGALLDWIGTRSELDRARVGVYGGSYGGYMVLAALAHFPDRLAAGAEIVGISNFVTFLENTKAYRRDLRRVEYGDERDPKMRAHLEAISPTALVDKYQRPLYVAQGLNDPRVPVGESEQIVEAVERKRIPVWYVLAMDEGHGFRKKKNRDFYSSSLALFWRTHLLGGE